VYRVTILVERIEVLVSGKMFHLKDAISRELDCCLNEVRLYFSFARIFCKGMVYFPDFDYVEWLNE
jgi:hypothetical protein